MIHRLASCFAAAAGCAVLALAGSAAAASITPLSYSFAQSTDCGSWCYTDSGSELTDGVVGNAGWALNAGAEWDGWTDPVVNVDFAFSGSPTFNSVSVGSTQDSLGDVALPSINIFSSLNGSLWTFQGSLIVPPSSANDNWAFSSAPHGFLTVSGLNFAAPYVRVQATQNGPWIFIDEVKFDGSVGGAVPEPMSWALLIAGFAGVGVALRRRRTATACA